MLHLFFVFFMAFWPSHARDTKTNHDVYQMAGVNGEDGGEDGGPGGETGHIPNQPPPRATP